MESQLNNKDFYKELPKDPTKLKLINLVNKLSPDMQAKIRILIPEDPQTPASFISSLNYKNSQNW